MNLSNSFSKRALPYHFCIYKYFQYFLYHRHGVNAPVVAENDGDYTFDKRAGLQWRLPVIDATNKTGSMEFSCGGNPDDFFPVQVSFFSKKTYSQIQV